MLKYRKITSKGCEIAAKNEGISAWAEGKYNTDYHLGIFLTKMNSSIIGAMVNYAKLSSENAEIAISIVKNAADFMINVSAPSGSPIDELPPTYYSVPGIDNQMHYHHVVSKRLNRTMLIYPCNAGNAIILLRRDRCQS